MRPLNCNMNQGQKVETCEDSPVIFVGILIAYIQYFTVCLESSSGSKSSNIWGQLRWRKINGEKYLEDIRDLYHRVKDGHKDTFSIGRSKRADFMVDDDKKISAVHCIIYCDYTQARLRFFIEVISLLYLRLLLSVPIFVNFNNEIFASFDNNNY